MRNSSSRLVLIISWMAGVAAAVVALALPLGYFGLSYQHEAAALETEAEINARIVTQLINANPDMWRYEELRLVELMSKRPGKGTKEIRRVVDLSGTVIAESAEPLGTPRITRSDALLDAGTVVGRIEISRSLRPLLIKTFFMTVLGSLVGLGVFFALRVVPLRALQKALKSLSREKERAQVTLRSIGDGVITTDAEGRVVLVNTVAENLTGWTQDEAGGRPLTDVFSIINEQTRKPCENPVERVLKEGKIIGLANHTALIARDGTERVIADSGAPIRDEDGSVIGVVLVFRDITQKQKIEDEMLRAGKLESIGILAGGIAHDFNNILTAIAGNISLALVETRPPDKLFKRLTDAEKACMRAKDLTYQLLTFSKGGAPVKKTVSLADIMQDAANFALAGSPVRSELLMPGDLWPVEADPGQMSQVANNLLLNACEAMPDGGFITISAENLTIKHDDLIPGAAGNYVKVSIRDQGVGIPREHLQRIFEPYFTTKHKGSGLGLAICYSIIRNHDGHITAESTPGRGTTFHVYLPASLNAIALPHTGEGEPVPGAGRILVMDDEEIVRDVAGQMLTHLGYEVEYARDGAEAIDLYKKAKESGAPFDAVIMDLTIPGGMGGKEAVQRLLKIDPDVKAVVSSGYSDNPVMSDFRKFGFSGGVAKPYKVPEMSRVLSQVLKKAT